MTDRLASVFVWISIVVTICAITVMLLTGTPEETPQEMPSVQEQVQQPPQEPKSLLVADETLPENCLQFSVPSSMDEKDIVVESDGINRVISLTMKREEGEEEFSTAFFYDNPIKANAAIEDVRIEESVDTVTIRMQLPSTFEGECRMESDGQLQTMFMQLVRPKEKYTRVVVLDAGHGGEDLGSFVQGEDEAVILSEKEVALSVVMQAGALLEQQGVKVYYTRTDDAAPTDEKRNDFANQVQADMLISVHADWADDTTLYGMRTIYNETYFISDFASADFAYLLLEKVAACTNEKAIGFEPGSSESELIRNAMVPVAQLNVGYMSNKQEQKLLAREDYVQRIAEGICEAVMAGYEEIEK